MIKLIYFYGNGGRVRVSQAGQFDFLGAELFSQTRILTDSEMDLISCRISL
jgi:hypothetical protein